VQNEENTERRSGQRYTEGEKRRGLNADVAEGAEKSWGEKIRAFLSGFEQVLVFSASFVCSVSSAFSSA
jgi:hypothetical protein